MSAGFVSIVGAGPWDPQLLTIAARDRLARAEVVIADEFVNPAILIHCPPEALILQRAHTSGLPLDQARINELLIEHARAGRRVVRLEGGDPMVFGRGAEQGRHLAEHEIDFEFVPGVCSPIAAPEAAGIPVTSRDTPSLSVVAGCEAYEEAGLGVAWEHLANSGGTLVLMMISAQNARRNAQRLVEAGRSEDTPAALVRWGTRGIQQTVIGTLANIGERVEAAAIRPPALLVVGDVVELREELAWLERRPLFGRRVVVTRAARQAGGLVDLLAAAGADAVAFPCLDFVPAEGDDQRALDRALAALSEPQKTTGDEGLAGVILSSPNGVEALTRGLERAQLDARLFAGLQIVAIGSGTAARLQARGLRPDIVPARARAEGLVDALRERGLLGARWLQIRADEGRRLLGEAIAEAGGALEVVVGYRTIRPKVSPLLLASLRPVDNDNEGGEGYDAICFASGRTARHFLDTTREAFGDDGARAQLARAKVIAIGPVTAKAIADLGVRVDGVASTPSDAGLLAAVSAALTSP